MRKQLLSLEELNTPIRVSIIGCGRFGSMMLTQIMRMPGMEIAVVCDLKPQRAINIFKNEGYSTKQILLTENISEANDAINKQIPVITRNTELSTNANVDVVVETTGDPDMGALHASNAISAGKHVVMVNVEADVLVGPELNQMAQSSGVVYSLAYGDQPAIIEELYDWATSLGFEVVAAGKGTMYLPEYRKGTPDEALSKYGHTPEEASESGLNPQMYNSFLDGTKSAVEMCAVANMTGLVPDVSGMHFPPSSIKDLPTLLIPTEDGGILSRKGVVEVISSLRRDGTQIPHSLRWGIFIVLTSDSPYLRTCLQDYGVPMDSSKTYAAVHRPYHLVGMEAPISIARAYLYNEPTGAPKAHIGEVIATAKRHLKTSEILDGEGGHTIYGSLVEAKESLTNSLLPIGFSRGAKVKSPIKEDTLLSYKDVQLPESGFANLLRNNKLD